jgi:ribosome-associated heat shock protein Hsp15
MADIVQGVVRVNGQRVTKAAYPVGQGDTLTFMHGDRVRLIRVLETGNRRGPATEARTLYLDLDAPMADAAPTPLE